jgi:hypothetical protein
MNFFNLRIVPVSRVTVYQLKKIRHQIAILSSKDFPSFHDNILLTTLMTVESFDSS